MKLFYTYDMPSKNVTTSSSILQNEPVIFKVVKAQNNEKVDFALSTYKNSYYTNFYVDRRYIRIYDSNGREVKPKQVFQFGDKNLQVSSLNVNAANGNGNNGNGNGNNGNGNGNNGNNGNQSLEDKFNEWEEWRDKNPWTTWEEWYDWDKIKDYIYATNVYSLDGNEEYTMYISDEYINQILNGGEILYLHSSLPRVKTTMPLFIMRRTIYELY